MDTFAYDGTSTVRTVVSLERTAKLLALVLLVAAVWLLQHPYRGLIDDAKIYTLLALARLHPQSLSHDVFLRFGSQNRYTVFSPIFAEAIRLFDLGPGAAVLTLLGEVAFYVSLYLLARRHMAATAALLSVAFIAVLPTDYGSHGIFRVTEDFVTPRLLSEALTLTGIAAFLGSRRGVGSVCLLGALLLHPLMALAGAALLGCLYVAFPHPKATFAGCAAAIVASLLLIAWLHRGPLARFDPEWLHVVRSSSPFLFISNWSVKDWSIASLPLAVLGCGLLKSADAQLRRLYSASLVIAFAGILLTVIYCDAMHSVLATQVQPWRWLWLSTTVAIGFSPWVARDCWRYGGATKAVPCLLVGALMLRGSVGCIVLSFAAVIGCATLDRIRNPRAVRLVLFTATAVLVAIAVRYAAILWLYRSINVIPEAGFSPALQRVQGVTRDGLLYAAAVALIWKLASKLRTTRAALVLLALSLIIVSGLAGSPEARSWITYTYTQALRVKFSDWRRRIPVSAEVAWPDQPIGDWYLLARPSYFSGPQIAGDVFSRPKSMLLKRRQNRISAAGAGDSALPGMLGWKLALNGLLGSRSAGSAELAALCADPALGFVVSNVKVAPTSFLPITPYARHPRERLYLYRCTDTRRSTRARSE